MLETTATTVAECSQGGMHLELLAETEALANHPAVVLLGHSLPQLWQGLHACLEADQALLLGLLPETALLVDITVVGNDSMQAINRDYRQKDSATDVLSFSLVADGDLALLPKLPMVQLGSILISLEWGEKEIGEADAGKKNQPLLAYLQERLVHGLLHLLGIHHDTEEDYQRVVAIQQAVLAGLTT